MTIGYSRQFRHRLEFPAMTDPSLPIEEFRCSWCSSTAGADDAGRCRSCGANVVEGELTAPVPGVTDVDTIGIMKQRGAREPNRIVSWVTGDVTADETWTPTDDALEAPSPDVVREMLRLELDAAIAARQAEIDAMKAEEALEAVSQSSGAPASAGPQSATPDETAQAPSEEPSAADVEHPAEADAEETPES